MTIPEKYFEEINKRSILRYTIGYIARFKKFLKYSIIRSLAKYNGADIGKDVILPWSLAKKCNSNLHIGDDTVIETDDIDLRDAVYIGKHCIINRGVCIIRVSHYIDNNNEFTARYYSPLVIEDYSWLVTRCVVLPSCCKIAYGSVIGAYSLLYKDSEPMGVYSGNPAKLVRYHNSIHDKRLICSLMGGDFRYYRKCK